MAKPEILPVVTLNLKCTCGKLRGDVSPTIIPNEAGDCVSVHYICPMCGAEILNPRPYRLAPFNRQ